MFRMFVLLATAFLPLAGMAQTCGTADLIEELSDADRARLDALVAPHPYPEGNIWRAERNGKTVTVVGTIHLPDPRLQGIVDQVKPDLLNADLLIIEASAEDEASIQTLAANQPEMFFITEGPTLIDLLSEDEWAKVTDRLAVLGMPGFLAAKFQPWYLSMTLAIPPCAMSAIQSGAKGLDRQLEVIANEAGLPIATLDDTEAVLRLFADEPVDKQLDGLRIALETQADADASTSTLIEAYFDGRVRESWEYGRIMVEASGIENGAELFEDVNQSLLVGRNEDWEPKIVELIAGKNAMIAVGAAHLSGESGVLRSLERAGYSLSRLE
ncbi:MAG: TraB/GumN family protein [Silicimonas sp.]|nr:TraB/GumN family protein [Silicimonas sp.]